MLFILYGGKPQWSELKHNGPLFPPLYQPHNIPIIVNNQEIILPPIAEEYATMIAKYLDKPDYINNNRFKKNFWKDFKKVLPSNLNIKSLEDIDFSLLTKITNPKFNLNKMVGLD